MALVVEVSAWVPHSSQAACQSNFSKNVQTPRRGARAWLCPAPCAGCRAPRRGRAVAPGRARAPRGRAGLPGWRVTSSICHPHGRTRKLAGLTELVRALRAGFSGPGRSPRWQWLLGRASCLALRSCRRQRYEDGARGAGAIHVSVLVSSSRTYAHRMCSLARAKTKPLTTGGQT